jgi:hypothetical protein
MGTRPFTKKVMNAGFHSVAAVPVATGIVKMGFHPHLRLLSTKIEGRPEGRTVLEIKKVKFVLIGCAFEMLLPVWDVRSTKVAELAKSRSEAKTGGAAATEAAAGRGGACNVWNFGFRLDK